MVNIDTSYLNRFVLTKCDLVEVILENMRFLIHITLMHILNCMVNEEKIFETKYLKVMLFTSIAVTLYHLFIKKLLIEKTKKLKLACTV
jgi:hypothetical protein